MTATTLAGERIDLVELRSAITKAVNKADGILRRADVPELRAVHDALIAQHRAVGRLIGD